jgi:hypothetical protein
VLAQRFNTNGEKVGVEVQIDSNPAEFDRKPSIAVAGDGSFVVAWQDLTTVNADVGLKSEIFRADFTDSAGAPYAEGFTSSGLWHVGPGHSFYFGQESTSTAPIGVSGTLLSPLIDLTRFSSSDNIQLRFSQTLSTIVRATSGESRDRDTARVAVWSGGNRTVLASDVNSVLPQSFNLSAFAGKQIQIEFQYVGGFQGFAFSNPRGWYIDDVSVTALGEDIVARRFSSLGVPVGSQFRVNASRPGIQANPTIAIGADGSFVVMWTSYSPNPGIYGQRYDAIGTPVGNAFLVTAEPVNPKVASAADGSFVVVWQSQQVVYVQRHDSSGARAGTQFRVDTLTGSPDVIMTADGGFVVAGTGPFERTSALYGQRYSSSGVPLGEAFLVNSPTGAPPAGSPSIAMSPTEDFAIAWAGQDVYAQRYDAAPPNVVESTNTSTSAYRFLSFSEPLKTDGPGAVTSTENWELRDADGHKISDPFASITQTVDAKTLRASVRIDFKSPLLPGDYRLSALGTIADLAGRQLDGNADGMGGDDYIDAFTIVPQPVVLGAMNDAGTSASSTDFRSAKVAINRLDGSYVLAWQGPGQGVGETDVFARRFDAQGVPLASVVRVNSSPTNNQLDPAIAMDDSGRYVIVWSSASSTGRGLGVFGRRYANDGTPMGDEFAVEPQATAALYRSRVAMYTDGGFVVAWHVGDENTKTIRAQRFSESGLRTGSQVEILAGRRDFDLALDGAGNLVIVWGQNGAQVGAMWFSVDGTKSEVLKVNAGTTAITPRVAMNRRGEFAIVWEEDSKILAQRFDRERRAIGRSFLVSTATARRGSMPDLSIDEDGNVGFVWTDPDGGPGPVVASRWFDSAGNRLADEVRVASLSGTDLRPVSIDATADGEIVIAWSEAGEGAKLRAQRFTLLPPTIKGVSVNPNRESVAVSFSQPMALSGSGSVLSPANWALQLADGRYIAQADPSLGGYDPRSTDEQIEDITFGFNPDTKQWEATIALNFRLTPGSYRLLARSSLQDAAGRRFNPVDESTQESWVFEVSEPSDDINQDGAVDLQDLEAICAALASGSATRGDIERFWSRQNTGPGDANFDHLFNSSDLVIVFQRGKYESNVTASWSEGDWNCDGFFDTADLVATFQRGWYEANPVKVTAGRTD